MLCFQNAFAVLKDHLLDIRDGIRDDRFSNESAVSQGIVLRLLQALEWPTYDTQVVIPEFSLEGRRVDLSRARQQAALPGAKPERSAS